MTMKALLAAKPAAGGFAPDDLAGGVVWLDASDAGTITESGGLVSAWEDKFNAYSFAEATNKPTTGANTQNGENVITFNGSQLLTYDAGSDAVDLSPMTVFVVVYISASTTAWRRFLSFRRSATAADDATSPNGCLLRMDSDTVSFVSAGISPTAVAYTDDTFLIVEGASNGSTVGIRVNGGTEQTASASPPDNMRYLRVGSDCTGSGTPPATGNYFTGRLAELIVYNADLSAGDRTSVRDYLNDKWAVY